MNHLRLPFDFSAAELQASFDLVPDDFWRESNSPYVSSETYFEAELIAPRPGEFDGDGVPIFDFKSGIPTDSYFRKVRSAFECVLESFRLTRLKPGGEIRPHRDFMYGFEHGLVRAHVPVITNGGSAIHFESGDPMVMNDGECWYGNFAVPHHLKNSSDNDRIHIVMDCRVNDWCRTMMEEAGAPSAK